MAEQLANHAILLVTGVLILLTIVLNVCHLEPSTLIMNVHALQDILILMDSVLILSVQQFLSANLAIYY